MKITLSVEEMIKFGENVMSSYRAIGQDETQAYAYHRQVGEMLQRELPKRPVPVTKSTLLCKMNVLSCPTCGLKVTLGQHRCDCGQVLDMTPVKGAEDEH